jgi:hypothetical protein
MNQTNIRDMALDYLRMGFLGVLIMDIVEPLEEAL